MKKSTNLIRIALFTLVIAASSLVVINGTSVNDSFTSATDDITARAITPHVNSTVTFYTGILTPLHPSHEMGTMLTYTTLGPQK